MCHLTVLSGCHPLVAASGLALGLLALEGTLEVLLLGWRQATHIHSHLGQAALWWRRSILFLLLLWPLLPAAGVLLLLLLVAAGPVPFQGQLGIGFQTRLLLGRGV